jgi:hypothetical protein
LELAALYLPGIPAQDGAVEGGHVQMVAGHLDLEDQLAGFLHGRPGRGERGENGGGGDEEEAVEADLGHIQLGRALPGGGGIGDRVTFAVSFAKVSLANWSSLPIRRWAPGGGDREWGARS